MRYYKYKQKGTTMIPFKDFIAEETSNEPSTKHKINITKSRSGHYTVSVRFKSGPTGPTSLKGIVGKLSPVTHARNAIPDAIEDLHNQYKKWGRSIPK